MIVLDPLMTTPDGGPASEPAGDPLLSDEPTLELVVRARSGDRVAMEALLERCMPPLKRWAHGRLPAAARGRLDTGDLVQEAALHVLGNLDTFEPRHVGAMQAYLRQSVINRIRDEVRRIGRQPPPLELPDDHPSDRTSPLEFAIKAEAYENYAVEIGYQFSSAKDFSWKQALRAKGLSVLKNYGYRFGRGDPEALFEYEFLDKLAWVLRPATDAMVGPAIRYN